MLLTDYSVVLFNKARQGPTASQGALASFEWTAILPSNRRTTGGATLGRMTVSKYKAKIETLSSFATASTTASITGSATFFQVLVVEADASVMTVSGNVSASMVLLRHFNRQARTISHSSQLKFDASSGAFNIR